MYLLKYSISLIMFISILNLYVPLAQADVSDVTDIATNAVSNAMSTDNEELKNDILDMLKNETHKQELEKYIIETRPIIESYQLKIELAENLAYVSEKYIPLIGGIISSTIMEGVFYFYEDDLSNMAKSDIAKKFNELRNNSIDYTKDLIARAISYEIEIQEDKSKINNMDISTTINLGIKFQQKTNAISYMEEIIRASGINYDIIDTGCVNNMGV